MCAAFNVCRCSVSDKGNLGRRLALSTAQFWQGCNAGLGLLLGCLGQPAGSEMSTALMRLYMHSQNIPQQLAFGSQSAKLEGGAQACSAYLAVLLRCSGLKITKHASLHHDSLFCACATHANLLAWPRCADFAGEQQGRIYYRGRQAAIGG